MQVPAKTIKILKRMVHEELIEFLGLRGIQYQAVNHLEATDKEALYEAERKTVLAAAHKARNALGPMNFTQDELRASRKWLKENGYRTGITKHRNH